ncbi:uncharacterized protein LOC119705643 isoform X2 [Motacilla alba alba]|uniref:uncharacterized protein LOC119705643 isoform X2 n=1 Tax=Motacilla alba alba TaxID=1094192 RepID=UPI0018D55698|nr:uncharacterized protein LOC119705643 isoform X2 [Motacilla alba alba]
MAERPIPGAEVRPSRKSSRIAAIKLKRARQSTRSGTRVAFGNGGGVAADPATTAWPPSTAQSCRPRTRAFLGERRLRDNSPVTAGTSQMARRPCFAPDTDRVPQMSEVLMHYILVRAPHPGLVGSPEQEVKPESSSQGQVGKAIDFAYVQPPPPASPCTGFPAHVGLVEVLQDSAMKPLNFLIHCPISADPATTASASEHGQSVRPEVLGILKNVLMHYILVWAPHPRLVGSPEQEVEADSSSQGQVGKAIDSADVQPPSRTGQCTGFPAHVGLVGVLQVFAMKPLNFLIHHPIWVAIRASQGVVADPATTASASEHGQSVRPEDLGILKNVSKIQQPGASRDCSDGEAAFFCT